MVEGDSEIDDLGNHGVSVEILAVHADYCDGRDCMALRVFPEVFQAWLGVSDDNGGLGVCEGIYRRKELLLSLS